MKAIVNVASGGWYIQGQKRLRDSLVDIHEEADRLFLRWFPGKSHRETPYGFKCDMFRLAQRRDYEQVLWIDSSCWVIRSLETAWKQIERDGYLLGLEGWTAGQWCSDEVLEMAGYSRAQALEIPLMEGKFIGLDLSSPKGNRFLDRWEHARDQGWFNGSWDNHRHDITAGALIAYEEGLTLTPNIIALPSRRSEPHPDVYCLAAGM